MYSLSICVLFVFGWSVVFGQIYLVFYVISFGIYCSILFSQIHVIMNSLVGLNICLDTKCFHWHLSCVSGKKNLTKRISKSEWLQIIRLSEHNLDRFVWFVYHDMAIIWKYCQKTSPHPQFCMRKQSTRELLCNTEKLLEFYFRLESMLFENHITNWRKLIIIVYNCWKSKFRKV